MNQEQKTIRSIKILILKFMFVVAMIMLGIVAVNYYVETSDDLFYFSCRTACDERGRVPVFDDGVCKCCVNMTSGNTSVLWNCFNISWY